MSFVFNSVQESEISLAQLAKFVTELTTIPVTLDLDSLAASNITADTLLSFEHRGITIGQLLTSALEPEGMDFVVANQQIIITTIEAAEGTLTQQSYNVADLVQSQEEMQALGKQLAQFVQPASWDVNGGQGTVTAEEYSLIIEQFPAVHFQVTVMLDRLRLARGLLPRSDLPVEWLAVDPVYERAADALSSPITVNYSTSTPVSRILTYLNNETDLTILVNWHAVADAGWSPNTSSQLVTTDKSLDALLTQWLGPANLSYRVVDEHTIQITSLAALEARPDVEFHRFQGNPDLVAVEKALRTQIEREATIPIVFDKPSNALIVSLPQSAQRRVTETIRTLANRSD
jgi:hypothetical protein